MYYHHHEMIGFHQRHHYWVNLSDDVPSRDFDFTPHFRNSNSSPCKLIYKQRQVINAVAGNRHREWRIYWSVTPLCAVWHPETVVRACNVSWLPLSLMLDAWDETGRGHLKLTATVLVIGFADLWLDVNVCRIRVNVFIWNVNTKRLVKSTVRDVSKANIINSNDLMKSCQLRSEHHSHTSKQGSCLITFDFWNNSSNYIPIKHWLEVSTWGKVSTLASVSLICWHKDKASHSQSVSLSVREVEQIAALDGTCVARNIQSQQLKSTNHNKAIIPQ